MYRLVSDYVYASVVHTDPGVPYREHSSKNMFYTVVGHAALHYASETPVFRQEQMVQLVACPTVSPSFLITGCESPEFPFFFYYFLVYFNEFQLLITRGVIDSFFKFNNRAV